MGYYSRQFAVLLEGDTVPEQGAIIEILKYKSELLCLLKLTEIKTGEV